MASDDEQKNGDGSDEDLENIVSIPVSDQEDFLSNDTKCQVAFSDLNLSSEIVESAICADDSDIVKSEISDIDKSVENFNCSHMQILDYCRKYGVESAEFDDRRKRFLVTVKGLKVKISKFLKSAENNNNSNGSENGNRLKYSKIDIKFFDGDKNDWPRFKAAFTTYYHEGNLTDLEKHQVLFTKTSGEANDLIREFPLNGKHYEDAWQTLLDHFDDPLKTVSRHLDALSNTASVGSTAGRDKKKQTLRNLITHFRPNVTAIQMTFTDNPEIDSTSQFFIHQFLTKADKSTRLEWEREMERRKTFATFKEFLAFMESRCNAYERATESSQSSTSTKVLAVRNNLKCYFCGISNHFLHRCPKFLEVKPEERSSFIRKKRLCPRCLRGKCGKTCTFKCRTCNGRHNTLIHLENPPKSAKQTTSNNNGESTLLNSNSLKIMNENSLIMKFLPDGWVGSVATDNLNALLATACVNITNAIKTNTSARALLDSASQLNFVTIDFARKINARPSRSYQSFNSVNQITSSSNLEISVSLKSRFSNFKIDIQCVIVDEIIDQIPNEYFSTDNWDFPKHLSMADPQFNIPSTVDLLLGASVFWKILKPNFCTIGSGLPKLFATHLGWLVAGDVNLEASENSNPNYIFLLSEKKFDTLTETIEKLWIINDSENSDWTLEELECEKHYLENTFRNEKGEFVVSNPFKISPLELGNTRFQALKRFYALERKMAKNLDFKTMYVAYMRDLIVQNHMRVVVDNPGEFQVFIPHHAIIKESSTSTPVRPVFDASMPTNSGLSLNDCLMKGPTIQSDLVSIMLRSRVHLIVFSADIKQMHRRVKINESDYCYQRIFWRENPTDELKIYELTTVIFGLTSAPFLATRCLKRLADDQGEEFPAAKGALLNDFYIDDVFTGADSIEEALNIKNQLTEILQGAGFELTKWCSSSLELLNGIPAEKLEKSFPLYNGKEFVVKTLGLIWLPHEDCYRVWVNLKKLATYTKRGILSLVASVFDPLGFLSPVTIIAKLIMQSLWIKPSKSALDWDSEVSEEIKQRWLDFSTQLPSLNNLYIQRSLFTKERPKVIELHGFSDASKKAYGAAIYIKGIDGTHVTTTLFCSKTKVAPLKNQSLARLELCAALLLAELVTKVLNSVNGILNFDIIRLWSDSEITLCWIDSSPKKWQIFVANRVEKIQNFTKNCYWDYVESKLNPADILSRGIEPELLKTCDMWWHGPKWLSRSHIPFGNKIAFESKNKRQSAEVRYSLKPIVCTTTNLIRSDFFSRFSDFKKLIRITAWCLRFIWNSFWCGPVPTIYLNTNLAHPRSSRFL